MSKPKRRPKNTAGDAGEAEKIVLSMSAGGHSARTERGASDGGVGNQAPTTSSTAKVRKARRIETKSSNRVPPAAPQQQQVAPQSPPTSASGESPRGKRGPSAATMAIVACFGGLVGSLATIGAAHYLPVGWVPSAIANGDLVHRLAHIDSELAVLEASIAPSAPKDATRGEEQSSSLPDQVAKVGNDTTGPMLDAPSPPVSTAAPDSVVDGWILRNVSGGSALVEGRPGLIQVMPGDSLPGVGRVETIKREDGRWVVVTAGGLIVSR